MEVKRFEGLAYSQVRVKIHTWLEKNSDFVIEKTTGKRVVKNQKMRVFYRIKFRRK